MRYDYKCECGAVVEVVHHMAQEPRVVCPKCGKDMQRKITVSNIQVEKWGSRTIKKPGTPSNEEYQAYKRYEKSGSQRDYDNWLHVKGEK